MESTTTDGLIDELIEAVRDYFGPHEWQGSIGGPDLAAQARFKRMRTALARLDEEEEFEEFTEEELDAMEAGERAYDRSKGN